MEDPSCRTRDRASERDWFKKLPWHIHDLTKNKAKQNQKHPLLVSHVVY